MKPHSEAALRPLDRALVAAARETIRLRYYPDKHHVGAALRTRSGRVFTGVHLEAYVGRIAVCAEAIALGVAAMAGDAEIETIVAVHYNGDVVSPCGMCREMISDFSPDARVIVPVNGACRVVSVRDLLPHKFFKRPHKKGLAARIAKARRKKR